MPKNTLHGGPTNAGEPDYFEAIEAKAVDGVPAAGSASGRSTLLGRYDAAKQASGQARLDAYQARLAELTEQE